MLGAIAVLLLLAERVSPVQNSTTTTTTTTTTTATAATTSTTSTTSTTATTAEVDPALVCVNDYLSTIHCSLDAPADRPPGNGSDWLTLAGLYMEGGLLVKKTERCPLRYADSVTLSCSVTIDRPAAFPDMMTFQIERCREGEPCVRLDDEYYPKYNIQPIPPGQLAVQLNSSEFHFSWDSGYDGQYPASSPQPNEYFVRALQYELWMVREGHDQSPVKVTPTGRSFKAGVDRLAVNAEYRARVRSGPDQREYEGEWSTWSPETRFVTPGTESTSVGLDTGLVVALSLVALVLLLLCSIPVLKLRRRKFIPTPVLRVSPLTSAYAGYIKSIEATPSIGKALKETEHTARVCVLTESVDIPAESGDARLHPDPGTERADPCGVGQTPAVEVSSLGVPYAVTPMMTDDAKSSAGTDSGCWHCSGTSVDGERDHRGYRNAYCTLAADRQCHLDCQSSTTGAPQTDPEHLARKPDYQNQGSSA